MTLFKILYWAALIVEIIIRAPYQRKRRQSTGKTVNAATRTEVILLTLLFIAGLPLPLIYTFTGWLGFADYILPEWAGGLGAAVMALGLYVFYRSHTDLRQNWSPTLEVYEEHTLITDGIYRKIRHPMYLSQFLVATAQALLLWNWLAGPLSIVVFALFYLFRVPEEEKMMLSTFGEQYHAYMQQTGGILPKVGK